MHILKCVYHYNNNSREASEDTTDHNIPWGGGAASRADTHQGRVSHTPDQYRPPATAATSYPSTHPTIFFPFFCFFFPFPSPLNRSVDV